jgi:hypothetical protein
MLAKLAKAAVFAIVVAVVIQLLPDVKRYLEMRRM